MNIYKLPVNAYNRGHEQTISEDIVRNKLVGKKKKRKEPSLWWKCERCGKLIPYMADFCHECVDELLGESPKPAKPQTESEEDEHMTADEFAELFTESGDKEQEE